MHMETAVCDYLKEEIFPQLSAGPYGEIEITRIASEKPVYLFYEKARNIMVVGKSFQYGTIPLEEAWLSAEKEYSNLTLLRKKFGLSGDTDMVIAPLGQNKELSALLVTERASGQTLDYYIARTCYEQEQEELFRKLGYLARFFVKLHRSTETQRQVSLDLPQCYLEKLLDSLSQGLLSCYLRNIIERYAVRWWDENGIFKEGKEVIVHGDATPTNFLFYDKNVIAIDLERMKWADRCWDLGFITAELKHHFMWRTGNPLAAEPFIGHFLWEYAVSYGDTNFFHVITRKIPLYMAIGLLRIARNLYLGESYREHLILEAKRCLKYGLSSSTATAH